MLILSSHSCLGSDIGLLTYGLQTINEISGVNYMDRYFGSLIYSKLNNPYISYFLMPILHAYRINKASVTFWGPKIWVQKLQIVNITNSCQEGFNEVLARASVTIHQAIMMVVGYSYIFWFSGHVDDLWTAAQHSYPIWYLYTYIVQKPIRTLVIGIGVTSPVKFPYCNSTPTFCCVKSSTFVTYVQGNTH